MKELKYQFLNKSIIMFKIRRYCFVGLIVSDATFSYKLILEFSAIDS